MTLPSFASLYNRAILQSGTLPLRPDGRTVPVEHRCTVVLIWPAAQPPDRANTLLVDPSFTRTGLAQATAVLGEIGASMADIGSFFVTHSHADHTLHLPRVPGGSDFTARPFVPSMTGPLAQIATGPCPGHSDDSRGLVFRSPADGEVWVVGDAILDEEWLASWMFYWPNDYVRDEIIQTWRTIAQIISRADLVIPGHGAPIRVTTALVERLLEKFSDARYAEACPDVADVLRRRLDGNTVRVQDQPGEK